ncbi:MAG: protein kinase, partial [Candidatus Brocadiaceae bacterium]
MDQLGRFVVRDELGAGPYSVVYEARDGNTVCALRVFNDDAVPSEGEGFAGLVRALEGLKRVEHPSVVKVLDAGEEEGQLFVAMELMDCPTLEQKLAEESPLEEKQVVLFIRQAAQALDKARDMGYFHGDLKPANVFVVSPEKVKLSDFAIKGFIEDPESYAGFVPEEEEEAGDAEATDWVTAEELLRARGRGVSKHKLEEDFTALAVLMLDMFGLDVPERGERSLDDHRSELVSGPVSALGSPDSEVSMQTTEVIRRLLTPGGFDSPGEVVVELASAMLLRRPFARAAEGAETPAASAETAAVSVGLEEVAEELSPAGAGDLETLEFRGDPRTAAFTPMFVWSGRRGGRFFVIHDGEKLTIGRDPDYADVALMDPAISRRHCILSREGNVV